MRTGIARGGAVRPCHTGGGAPVAQPSRFFFRYSASLRRIAGLAAEGAVPAPVFTASLSYLDTYAAKELDTGIVELMRDYIQDAGFEKKEEEKKRYHADWKDVRDEINCREIIK